MTTASPARRRSATPVKMPTPKPPVEAVVGDKPTPAVQLARAKKAIESMTDDLRKFYEDIRDRVAQLNSDQIDARYELGKELAVVLSDTTGKYGTDARATLSKLTRAFIVGRDVLRSAWQFADRFTEEDVVRLKEMRHPDAGVCLNWSHVAVLVRVVDAEDRWKYAQMAVDNLMTSKELDRLIDADRRASGVRMSGGGRKKKRPTSLRGFIDQAQLYLRDVFERMRDIQLSPSDGVARVFKQTPPAELTDETARQMQVIVNMTKELTTVLSSLGREYAVMAAQVAQSKKPMKV